MALREKFRPLSSKKSGKLAGMSILSDYAQRAGEINVSYSVQLLLLVLFGLLLEAYWRLYQPHLKKYLKEKKKKQPKKQRKLKPKSPRACAACQAGSHLHYFRPRTDVVPYAQIKSPRGRKKMIRTAGHTCPNRKCKYFEVTAEELHALVGDGKRGKNKAIQYFKCQACATRFSSRLYTPLYRLKTDPDRVALVLLFLAEGCDRAMLVRSTRHTEETVTRWLERMGQHSQELHNVYFQCLFIPLLQLDELYARVRQEGARWLWLVLDPVSKIIPVMHLGGRKTEDGMQVVHELQQRLAPGVLPAFTTDGLSAYFYALTAHFGHWHLPEGARKPRWEVADELLHGQVVKKKKGRKILTTTRMAVGEARALYGVLKEHGFRAVIQTAFIERVNLTLRRGISALMRKTWSYAQTSASLRSQSAWWRSYYHFVRPHASLTVAVPGLRRKRRRTPAMAAGMTARPWTMDEILRRPVIPVRA